MARIVALAFAVSLCASCSGPPAEGRFPCTTPRDCPAAWYCRMDGLCWSTPDPDAGPTGDVGLRDGGTGDGGTSDGGADVGAPMDVGVDGGADPVTVVVQDTYSDPARTVHPISGARVVFHDSTGMPIDLQLTDTDGRATSTRGAIDAVTVVQPGDAQIRTLVGVQPPESIVWDLGDPPMTNVEVTLPGSFAGAERYFVDGGCGPQTPTDITSPIGVCTWSGTGSMSITAFALDATGNTLAWTAAVEVPDAATLTLPAWSTGFGSAVPFTVSGRPSALVRSAAFVGFNRWTSFVAGDFGQGRSGTLRPILALDFSGRPFGVELFVDETTPSGLVQGRLELDFHSSLPTDIPVDVAISPWIDAYSAVRTDLDRPRLSLTPSGAPADYTIATFQYHLLWAVVAPGDATEIALPRLPDSMASLRPGSELVNWSVARIDSSLVSAAAQVRAHPLGFLYSPTNSATASGSL